MPWDCLAHAHAFLYYGSTKDVSNSIGTIHNSNFTHHFTNLLYMMCMCQKSSETWFARLLWWQFFGHSYWFSRRTFQSHAAAGALSLSEAAIVNLLSLQRALRKHDRWSGLVVMVMGDFLRVRERRMSDGDEWWVMRDFRAIYWNLQRVHTGA